MDTAPGTRDTGRSRASIADENRSTASSTETPVCGLAAERSRSTAVRDRRAAADERAADDSPVRGGRSDSAARGSAVRDNVAPHAAVPHEVLVDVAARRAALVAVARREVPVGAAGRRAGRADATARRAWTVDATALHLEEAARHAAPPVAAPNHRRRFATARRGSARDPARALLTVRRVSAPSALTRRSTIAEKCDACNPLDRRSKELRGNMLATARGVFTG